ncbi:MAG: GtrA family protein [Rhodoferax sp.]|nr:GtrA family protein [Rhodoferax sp.]
MNLKFDINRKLIKQFLQYVTVGLCALAVDVGSFTLVRSLGLDLVSANVLARFAGAVTAYTGNYLWTFEQSKNSADWLRTSWRYAAVWVAATTLSTLLLSALTHFGLPETPSKLGVEMVMPFLNFLVARVWVFKAR